MYDDDVESNDEALSESVAGEAVATAAPPHDPESGDPDTSDPDTSDPDTSDPDTSDTAGTSLPGGTRPWLIGAYSALVLAIGWGYGLLSTTRAFPFSVIWAVKGWSRCLGDGMTTCTYMGYPVGVRLSLGATYQIGAYVLGLLHIGPVLAMNLLALAAIALGCVAIGWIARCLGGHPAVGVVAAGLYYLSPVVISNRLLPSLYFGFAMVALPAACIADVMVSLARGRRRRAMIALALALVSGMLVVFCDPYAWIVASALAGAFALVAVVRAAVAHRWVDLALGAAGAVVLLLPGVVFALFVGSDAATTSQLNFYRAMGADLGVVLAPPGNSWWATVLHLPHARIVASEYWGDGSNLLVFVGVVSVVAAVCGFVWLWRTVRPERRLPLLLFTLAGVGCLLMALGPSLKWFDRRDADPSPGQVSFLDYLMPARDATLSMPWSFLYGRQPASSLRAVFRWEVGFRVIVGLLGATVVVALWRQRRRVVLGRVVAAVLLVVLVAEAGSSAVSVARRYTAYDYGELQQFSADMSAQYGNDALHQGERVLFLPSANDYLIAGTAPLQRLAAWNIMFDKEVVRIAPLQPRRINDARSAYAKGKFTADQACSLFSAGLVEALVLTEYDQRWDAYSWPPSASRRATARAVITATGVPADARFDVDDRGLSVIVRARAGGSCTPSA